MSKIILINKMPLRCTSEGPSIIEEMIEDVPNRLCLVDESESSWDKWNKWILIPRVFEPVNTWKLLPEWVTELERR